MKAPIFMVLVFISGMLAQASDFPRVDADIAAYDARVAQLKAAFEAQAAQPSNKGWVKSKLDHMVQLDQLVRDTAMNLPFQRAYDEREKSEFRLQIMSRWEKVDAKNTGDLKELLQLYSWFKVSEFETKADQDAWILGSVRRMQK